MRSEKAVLILLMCAFLVVFSLLLYGVGELLTREYAQAIAECEVKTGKACTIRALPIEEALDGKHP